MKKIFSNCNEILKKFLQDSPKLFVLFFMKKARRF